MTRNRKETVPKTTYLFGFTGGDIVILVALVSLLGLGLIPAGLKGACRQGETNLLCPTTATGVAAEPASSPELTSTPTPTAESASPTPLPPTPTQTATDAPPTATPPPPTATATVTEAPTSTPTTLPTTTPPPTASSTPLPSATPPDSTAAEEPTTEETDNDQEEAAASEPIPAIRELTGQISDQLQVGTSHRFEFSGSMRIFMFFRPDVNANNQNLVKFEVFDNSVQTLHLGTPPNTIPGGAGGLSWDGGTAGNHYTLTIRNDSDKAINYCLAPMEIFEWVCDQ